MKKNRILPRLLAASILLLFVMPEFVSMARGQASISDIQIDTGNGYLSTGFQLQDCFTSGMEEAILSGVPTTFRIRIILEEQGAGVPLFRTRVLDTVLERTIKFDHLKNEFRVFLQEETQPTQVTEDFDTAKEWMSQVESLPLIPLWRLEKDKAYKLRVKGELSKVNLPLFFRYIFFFVSLWDFETAWQEESFTY